MSEPNEVQALEKISSEVGDSQIKITLSSQCIKAQAFLVDKLRKQSVRQKEICSYVSKSNLKLQTEIRQAEIEIQSLLIAKETIKSSNVELKKEFLLLKERKQEIEERIKEGEKKYENLWLEAKARYESVPHVQKLLQAQNKTETLKQNLLLLNTKSVNLSKEIEIKNQFIANSDRERIVELAQYMVYELPKGIKIVHEKNKEIVKLLKNIDEINKQQEDKLSVPKTVTTNNNSFNPIPSDGNEMKKKKNTEEDGWFNFCQVDQRDSITMPTIQLVQSDFDALSAKLDQIKIKKVDMFNITPVKRVDSIEPETGIQSKKLKLDDESTIAFNEKITEKNESDCKKESFSKKKLINILEDVKLDANDAYEIVSKVNPDKLKGVNQIGADASVRKESFNLQEETNDDIEEIDLTNSSNNLLVPPTQFLDFGEINYYSGSQQQVEVIVHMSMSGSPGKVNQNLRNSQENKKNVSFDIPVSIQEINEESENFGDLEPTNDENVISINKNDGNETLDSEVDVNLCNESYDKMKDMILKKHNLDSSPQFVYAKNSILQVPNTTNDKIITSKFFQNGKQETVIQNDNMPEANENLQKCESISTNQKAFDEHTNMKVDEIVVSSPKGNTDVIQAQSVTGLLFKHGTQGIPDSLNVSISTTGFEEGDSDFPHCLDTSLLLSPKADYPMSASGQNTEITSQEVPNFLSGLRRTAFSFFGQSAGPSETKANTNEQSENNFNFNFGDEKKGRGGLFNMFN
ncbi:unnamed protein product [Chilo suppressalis]|uniref:Lebercilin domain-containing protein n=1 Tax=Chilo suppressalis TaxID=168631 RepID=A0ABN8AYA9_CHISP|nr:unnamed protein product [Chilo suppressalis]